MKGKATENRFQLSIIEALGMLLVYKFLLTFIIVIPFAIISETSFSKSHETFEAAMEVLRELALNIIIITLILKKIRKEYEKDFKLRYTGQLNFKLLFYTLFLMLGFYLWYNSSIGIVTEKIPISPLTLQLMEEFAKELTQKPYMSLILVSITAPIFEEIIYRGIILRGFLNMYKPKTAILASALIFGLIHFNIQQSIIAAVVGLVLGTLYYKTGSLILCIFAHMINNTIVFISLFITIPLNTASFFIGILLFITSAIFIKRATNDGKRLKVDGTLDEVTT